MENQIYFFGGIILFLLLTIYSNRSIRHWQKIVEQMRDEVVRRGEIIRQLSERNQEDKKRHEKIVSSLEDMLMKMPADQFDLLNHFDELEEKKPVSNASMLLLKEIEKYFNVEFRKIFGKCSKMRKEAAEEERTRSTRIFEEKCRLGVDDG